MISKYKHKTLTWVDLESPKEEEIVYLFEEYTIPLFIKEEIISKPVTDIIRLDHGCIFASFDFPKAPLDKDTDNKLIFIANDNFIITIHNEPIQALNGFLKEIELNTLTEEKLQINDNNLLFAHLLKSLYVNSQKQLIANDIKIKTLKKQLIKNNKKLKLLTISTFFILLAVILIYIYAFNYI